MLLSQDNHPGEDPNNHYPGEDPNIYIYITPTVYNTDKYFTNLSSTSLDVLLSQDDYPGEVPNAPIMWGENSGIFHTEIRLKHLEKFADFLGLCFKLPSKTFTAGQFSGRNSQKSAACDRERI